jgi:hypothetical protein
VAHREGSGRDLYCNWNAFFTLSHSVRPEFHDALVWPDEKRPSPGWQSLQVRRDDETGCRGFRGVVRATLSSSPPSLLRAWSQPETYQEMLYHLLERGGVLQSPSVAMFVPNSPVNGRETNSIIRTSSSSILTPWCRVSCQKAFDPACHEVPCSCHFAIGPHPMLDP